MDRFNNNITVNRLINKDSMQNTFHHHMGKICAIKIKELRHFILLLKALL